jgi:hypothetical protein
MRSLRLFEEYLEIGIVKKQKPDNSRAKSLIEESKSSYIILKNIVSMIKDIDKSSNYIIKNAYDIIMELIRAIMLKDGYNASGFGAHEAEVAYLRVLKFRENEIQFVNQLRYFRNGILYYGKEFDKEYADKVMIFLNKIFVELVNVQNP